MSADAPLIDLHNDLPWRCRQRTGGDWARLDLSDAPTHTDIPRLRAGGVGAQFWSVFVPGTLPAHENVTATLEQIDAVRRLIETHPETFAAARSADDVERVCATGRIASLMGVEGGHSIACSLGVLRTLHALGVAYLTLTHNEHVPWADSAAHPPRLGGLSAFGREVVREMNRLGMLVDLSHTAPGTMRDAVATSTAPVVFTHSNALSLTDHPRNVPDDVLVTVARAGGVCCATFVPAFCSQERRDWEQELEHAALAAGVDPTDEAALARFYGDHAETAPAVGVAHVADHVERLRETTGVEHVGLGGDFDGTPAMPVGLEDVGGYPRLLAELESRGWSAHELGLLRGGNVLRLLRDAQQAADEQSSTPPSLATIRRTDGLGKSDDGAPDVPAAFVPLVNRSF